MRLNLGGTATALAVSAALGLAACGDDEDAGTTAETPTAATADLAPVKDYLTEHTEALVAETETMADNLRQIGLSANTHAAAITIHIALTGSLRAHASTTIDAVPRAMTAPQPSTRGHFNAAGAATAVVMGKESGGTLPRAVSSFKSGAHLLPT